MRVLSFKHIAVFVWLLFASGLGFAIEGDEIRGQVLEVDEEADTLTIQPIEVGEALDVPTDQPQTFSVDDATQIRDDVYATQLDDLENIEENDIVRLDFEIREGGQMLARNIVRDGGQAATDQDRQQLAQLPDTASIWPLLAVSGFAAWSVALFLRLWRKR